jgi:hypothetical protein
VVKEVSKNKNKMNVGDTENGKFRKMAVGIAGEPECDWQTVRLRI